MKANVWVEPDDGNVSTAHLIVKNTILAACMIIRRSNWLVLRT